MIVSEDDPEDVKRATPVENEIKRGEKDDTFERYPRPEKRRQKYQHCDKLAAKKRKPAKVKDDDCCQTKREKNRRDARERSKRTAVMVFAKPCTFPKLEIVPRQNLSRKQYIDMLATPSRKCPSPCEKKLVLRKLRPVSERIKELALPTRKRMMITLQEGASTLSPILLDNLIKTIEGESALTPEQAADAFRERKRVARRSKKVRSSSGKVSPQVAGSRRRSSRGSRASDFRRQESTSLDETSTWRQYLMAERFVRGILTRPDARTLPREDFADIAAVVLDRLAKVLEYEPTRDDEDRTSQQMRLLADLVAGWIAGVVLEVAEIHAREIEEECERRRREMEEETDSDEEEEEDEEEKLRDVEEVLRGREEVLQEQDTS